MKVELKNVKYAEFNSEETNCFHATILIDGVIAGEVSNAGHGGPDEFRPWELQKRLEAYAKTLPPYTFEGETVPHNAETAIGELFDQWLLTRDLKKRITKKMLFTIKGKKGVFATSFKQPGALPKILADGPALNAFRQRHQCAIILNTLPFEEALRVYREAA